MTKKCKSHSTKDIVAEAEFQLKSSGCIFLYTNFFLYGFCGGLNYAHSKKTQVNIFKNTNMDVCGKLGHSISEKKTN